MGAEVDVPTPTLNEQGILGRSRTAILEAMPGQYRPPQARPQPTMKMRKKSELPTKLCAHCSLPFTWRKKWERDWDQVKYCSERCRRAGKHGQ
jgi:hypothetical protein